MARDCIPRALSNLFYRYGKFVARHPLPFLIIPPIIAVALAIGVIKIETNSDAEYLYAPVGSRSKDEQTFFLDSFPSDDVEHFTALRLIQLFGFFQLHIEDKNGLNVLNDGAVASIQNINNFILRFKIDHNGREYNYSDICAAWQGDCQYVGFLAIVDDQATGMDNINISFPFHPLSNGLVLNMIAELGDTRVDDNGIVQSARAIRMSYFVRYQNSEDQKRSTVWLNGLRDEFHKYTDPEVNIRFQSSLSLEQELEDSVSSIIPLFAIAYTVLAIFAVSSCMMFDWVRSKPWIGMAGMSASALGIISSLGVMSAVGVKFASVVGIMPFLIIGIGLDDMFILVSAWRYTSFKESTEERTGKMLRSAAVSITITSVTDVIAFGVGCLTPFRAVTIFCAYTATSLAFVYIYMITFTVACVVYSGRREEANKHPLACQKVLPKRDAGAKSSCYRFCCAGGDLEKDPENGSIVLEVDVVKPPPPTINQLPTNQPTIDPLLAEGIQLPWLNKFLGTSYADFIMTTPVKITVVLIYVSLLAGAIYGIATLDEGLDRANLAPDGSYFREYFDKYVRDFDSKFGPVMMVALDEPLDYSRQSIRNEIHDVIEKFTENKYFVSDPSFIAFWLDNFESYLANNGTDISEFTSMDTFIAALRGRGFLETIGYDRHKVDIVFDSNYTSIKRSRFFIQTEALGDAVDEKNMMLTAREIADDSKFEVKVFMPHFIFFDQYAVITETTLQNLGIAVASMMVVSLVLIPSLTTVLWVTLATVSICTCMVGYMSHWGVSLDSISMINIVMCIGFSVDFAAHISYHFVISPSRDPTQRARDALGYLGTPIVQGAVSTILAVLALSTANTYIFRTFFKLVFLVMVFGFYHAMFLLPVLLSTLNCMCCRKESNVLKNAKSSNNTLSTSASTSTSGALSGRDNKAFNS